MKPFLLLSVLLCESLVRAPHAALAKGVPRARASCVGQCAQPGAKRAGANGSESRKTTGMGAQADRRRNEAPVDAPSPESRAVSAKSGSIRTAALFTRTHRVGRGENLKKIALRYDSTPELVSIANGLRSGESVHEGQLLVVPRKSETLPERTAASALWLRYAATPKVRGYIDISNRVARYEGRVVDERGRVSTPAFRALSGLLGAGGDHPPLPERLVRLLVQVSDTFGGRPIHIVSGYRTSSYFQDSRHKHSSAIDFSIAGVPNAIIRDYLRELDDVGVGYYPNSTFVHLDVRSQSAYWIDYAGPGEAPRSSPNAPPQPRAAAKRLFAELEELFKDATKTLERAKEQAAHARAARRDAARAAHPIEQSHAEPESNPRERARANSNDDAPPPASDEPHDTSDDSPALPTLPSL